jgi:hypothetical protein
VLRRRSSGVTPFADVADRRGEDWRAGDVDTPDGELHREDRAVRAYGLDLDAVSEHLAGPCMRTIRGPACERSPVGIPVRGWDDELGQLATEDVVAEVAERLLRRLVELEDEALVIDDHDAVERRIEDRVGVCRTEID